MSLITNQKTIRFMTELRTSFRILEEAKKRGLYLILEEAHQIWAEYSDSRAAGWLTFHEEDPVSEIWTAIAEWKERHGGKEDK